MAGTAFSALAETEGGEDEPVSAVLRDLAREMDAVDDDALLALLPDAAKRIRARLDELDAAPSAGTAAERAELAEALADFDEVDNDLFLLPGGSYFDESGGDAWQPTFDEWMKAAKEQAEAAVEESERAGEVAAKADEELASEIGSRASGTPIRGGSAGGIAAPSRGGGTTAGSSRSSPHGPGSPAARAGGGGSAPAGGVATATALGEIVDEVAFTNLVWKFGGVDASAAVADGPAIQMLRCSAEGMAFDWVRDLSSWGLAHDDAGALACLFVQTANGEWIGGKFEWISSSRHNRSFENVFEGYNGWTLAGIPRSTMVAFVVVSRNGSRRSNVISALWER